MFADSPSPPGATGARATGGGAVSPGELPVTAMVEFLGGLDVTACDAEAALEVAACCQRVVAFAHAVQVQALAHFAGLRPAEGDHTRLFGEFAADEVAAALRWTRSAAAARLAYAVDLARRHPEALAALDRGELDLYRSRILHEHTVALTDEQAGQVDQIVLPEASGQNPAVFRRAVRAAVLRVDPHGEDRRHRAARQERRVRLYPLPDGMADLTATLPAEHATAIFERIDRIARGLPADGAERSADARRADVFTDLLLADAGGDSAMRPLVHVTVAATTLLGMDEQPGDLAGYGPVPASVARAIAADPTSTWRRILTDPADGTLVEHGRRSYRPPAAVSDHVRTRDRTCRFPGCHHPATTADLDHTVPYPEGETSAGNLGALCRHHHRLKHKTQWTVEQRGGSFTWTSPTGRTYTSRPQRLHPEQQPPAHVHPPPESP